MKTVKKISVFKFAVKSRSMFKNSGSQPFLYVYTLLSYSNHNGQITNGKRSTMKVLPGSVPLCPRRNFQFCTHRIVIYIFSTDQKSKIFSLLIKILSLSSWSDQEPLYVSCRGKAFFSDFLR